MGMIITILIVGMLALVLFNLPYQKVAEITATVRNEMIEKTTNETLLAPIWIPMAYAGEFAIKTGYKLGEIFGWYGIIVLIILSILGLTIPGFAWLILATYYILKHRKNKEQI